MSCLSGLIKIKDIIVYVIMFLVTNFLKLIKKIYRKIRPIVAVSGGFDIIHLGHLALFKEASKIGRVVAILNSDEFLRKKKGYYAFNIAERKAILESIKYIYKVVEAIDKDDTVQETLKILKPDYFANGGDRLSEKDVPEAEICKKLKIKMVFLGGEKVNSSRWIVNKIARQKLRNASRFRINLNENGNHFPN